MRPCFTVGPYDCELLSSYFFPHTSNLSTTSTYPQLTKYYSSKSPMCILSVSRVVGLVVFHNI